MTKRTGREGGGRTRTRIPTIAAVARSTSLLLVLLLHLHIRPATGNNEFEPYQLNGGLVTGVASKDFVLIASDTRFSGEGGYDILSRDHLSSRIWNAAPAAWEIGNIGGDSSFLRNNLPTTGNKKGGGGGGWFGGVGGIGRATKRDASIDGAAETPSQPNRNNNYENNNNDDDRSSFLVSSFILPDSLPPPVFVGSVGCNADCEQLKRDIQMDIRSGIYFGECVCGTTTTSKLAVDQVATLLGQVLYSRRTFPYYSFCIVVGMNDNNGDDDEDSNNLGGGGGQVYVYDAIGSYEQVAVASTGTGRELLQPILDRKFRTLLTTTNNNNKSPNSSNSNKVIPSTTTTTATTTTTTTVPTLIDCQEPQEAIDIIVDAYRSVSEREIGVGDNVVVVCLRRRRKQQQEQSSSDHDNNSNNNEHVLECSVYKYPLKKH